MASIELAEPSYRELLDSLNEGVYFVDRDRRISFWNRAAERITGFSAQEVLGKRCLDSVLTHTDQQGESLCEGACPVEAAMAEGQPCEAEVFLHHRDGHRVPVSVRVAPVRNPHGEIVGAVELFSDNSPKVAFQARIQELEKLVLLDPLTRLGNRRYVEMSLHARLHELERFGWPVAILFMDIDDFKQVNDRYGHDVGDEALRMVANTLLNNSRPFDLFGRWGGDELVGILGHVEEDDLCGIGNRLLVLVQNSYLSHGPERIHVTLSAGVTMARPGDKVETLLKRADRLLYQSKGQGGNCLVCE
jgi:diguanylate cyclase (GGDEF)-like protein/PAS domain S-box-containing protein